MTSPGTPEPENRESELERFAEHVVPFSGRISGEMHEIADEIGKEGEAEDRLLDGIGPAIADQPSPVGEGVDLAPITAVDPGFDPVVFRTIARETFIKVREAVSTEREQEDDGLMTPALEHEVDDEIFNEAATGHRHVYSGLEVAEATIVAATVEEGSEKLTVRFLAKAEQIERDDNSGTILSDEGSAHTFTEVWQFARNPSVDSSASDAEHAATFGPDAWLFAHRGWVVTDIKAPAA